MRYYGCKTKLLNYIEDVVRSLNLPPGSTFFDIFSGTATVGIHFKKLGYKVYSNDFLEFAYAMANCYIETNTQPSFKGLKNEISGKVDSNKVIKYLNKLSGKVDFITKNYSPYKGNWRKYLSVINAQKVDAIRKKIQDWKVNKLINKSEYYYLITSLINAINLRSNVAGTYAAYLKTWDLRALKPLLLTPPQIIESNKKNLSFKADANKIISKYKVDLLYLDPPYNSRQFASNYFFLELIAEGWFNKTPKIYGQTGMRPYEGQKSLYSMKEKATNALEEIVKKAKTKYIILSYNNEGIIPCNKIKQILGKRGKVKEYTKTHKRFRSINQDGSRIKTKESLYIVRIEE